MATYDFAYYGYPLDEATLKKMPAELSGAVWHELHNNYDSDWLSKSYHGSGALPMWIGVEVDIVKTAMAHKHIKFKEYVLSPSIEDTMVYTEMFAKVWEKVPVNIKEALMVIHGEPELWIGESTD